MASPPCRCAVLCLLIIVSVVTASEVAHHSAHAQIRRQLASGAPAAEAAAAAAAGPSQPPPPTVAFSCPPGANFTNDQQGNGHVDVTADQATVRPPLTGDYTRMLQLSSTSAP